MILALPLGAYFLVQLPVVQTYLTRQIAKQVSSNLNAKFEVGRVDIVFFNRVLLRDVYIEDQQGDTLLKAARITATVNNLNRSNRYIGFNHIILHDASINLRTEKDSILNLQFILDAISSEDTTKTKWDYSINAVNIRDSRLTYKKHNPLVRDYGINFQDIELKRLNLLANKIHTTTDSVHFNISYLNFKEKSGFSLNHFTSENSISASGINIRRLRILTPETRLDLEHFDMNYNDFQAFNDFVNKVTITSSFNHSIIRFRDISYFAPGLKDFELGLTLTGEVSGRINNLKGSEINIASFNETSLTADFNMIGLPEFGETFIFLDLDNVTTSAGDILEIIEKSDPGFDFANIPEGFDNLEIITYRGKFTGFIDDFVAYGELNSGLGTILTDLALQPGTDNILNFDGNLRAIYFDFGALTGSDLVGRFTFNAGINGNASTHSGIKANMEGIIDSMQIYGYTYKLVQLEGELDDKKFNGSAYINDPNIILEFLGSIDLTNEVPEFDFYANISGARLYDLNIEKKDPSLKVSFYSIANFRGNNPDNLEGRISLINTSFEKEGHFFEMDNISLVASGTNDHKEINLNSSLADARITGSYEFATIIRSFNHLIQNYIPSYAANSDILRENTGNNFSFNFHLKDTEGFTKFFTPEFYISDNTLIEGVYAPYQNNSVLNAYAEELMLNRHKFQNISISTVSSDSVFQIYSKVSSALIFDRFKLENINLNSGILDDSISFKLEWDNKDKISYKGDIFSYATLKNNPGKTLPLTDIVILPSTIVVADSVWHIARSMISIDSTSYNIDNFLFENTGQHFGLNGKLSSDPEDSLQLEFRNMDLQNIELFTSFRNFSMSGALSGYASFSDIYMNPVFKSDLEVKDLFLNDQNFGNLSILSNWNSADRKINIHTLSNRGDDRIIDIAGNYIPDGGLLDFNIMLNKINLRTFDGYLEEVFASIRGMASGDLSLTGTIREPLFNGNILLQKTSFMIDYLKTQYNFTHDIQISDNEIVFNDISIYDINHNICRANGRITSNYFRDFALNIYLYPDRFMALNTIERDNDLFFGRVFASGLVHLSGPVNNILMNISARTNRNTQFYIPLQKSSKIEEHNFLNFTGKLSAESDNQQDIRRYEVDLSGIQLNFDLDVTPEAEVQIIFDSKIGDIIRGRGNGSFKMEINTLGQFNMFGEYEIEQGDYLFTLQNVINKRFDIEQGGTISWNGDPFDANIDLKAVYRLRTSLKPLMEQYVNITEDQYSRRIPVECQIIMKEKLMTPDISFGIDLPTVDQDTRRDVLGILNNEEKRNRQFLALLVINNFIPEQDFAGQGAGSTLGMSATGASMTTVSEFFSNQLSNWLSQLSRDVDFGINWRPGDDITPDEVELALSTQLLNDRVSINGHVDVGGRQANTSNIVGDFDVDIKLNRSGKLRLKAFTRANDNLIRTHLSPYTQGIGLFYREEFDNFEELMSRYWSMIFSSEKEDINE